MKDRKNWSSELKLEEVSAGLETVKEQLNGRVVCLHTDSRYGVPDAITSYLIQNFNDLGIKKLIITSFPIPEDAEEWTELLEGEKYVIDKVPSKLAEETDCLSIVVEHFLSNHRETFKIKDNSRKAAHIRMINAADIVIGFPSLNILEPYVRLLEKHNKNFIIGGYVNEENFIDYLEAFEMRNFEITSVNKTKHTDYFNEFNGSVIWMDNFDKLTSYYSTDREFDYEEDEI